jgi:transaldolase
MNNDYFHRLHQQTPTVFWVNNPTSDEAGSAIAAGALGCTCNPSFCQKMLDHPKEGQRAQALLEDAIKETETDSDAETLLQRRLALPVIEQFRPLHQANPHRDGYVSLQGDPLREDDPAAILSAARANREVAPNVCIKIPVTSAGLSAIETLLAEGTPINATEVMSVAQAISVCELHEEMARRTGRRTVLFMSHIAGIFDDYLARQVEREKIEISRDVLWQAGLAVARKVYQVMQERGYSAIFIAGGARGLHHFTEMVGGRLVVTINWAGTADRLITTNPPVVSRLFNPVPLRVISELMEKLPDFRSAYLEAGLPVDQYGEFGAVEHFRHMFVASWTRVLDTVRERRGRANDSPELRREPILSR